MHLKCGLSFKLAILPFTNSAMSINVMNSEYEWQSGILVEKYRIININQQTTRQMKNMEFFRVQAVVL